MGISVLGPVRVGGTGVEGSRLPPRERVVLSALVVSAGEVVPADRLAEALWGGSPPATWSKSLQGSVVRLRRLLGPAAIETVDHGYRLALPAGQIDAREFERLLGRGRELLVTGQPERAEHVVGEALELWRGAALADLEEWEPGRQEAERLAELRRDAEELAVEATLRAGRHGEVLGRARLLVEQAPLRERRWELLALAQYRSGQQADALRTLQQLRRVLVAELGLDPGPDAVALEQSILRQDPSLAAGSAPVVASEVCPYPGLVPFDVEDAEAFFGRARDVETCRRRLAEVSLLAVVGPSGSGKSSLVRAGVAAGLRRDGERVVVLTPGRRPVRSLDAVPATGRVPVLVVDQAEEALTAEDPREVAAFFAALVEHASRGRVVIALRGDRLGDLAAYAGFARLVEQGLFLLTPMTAEELREAVEGPARLAGLRLEPGLVEVLVAEVEGRPGALPHLSHALRETWAHREGPVLTLDGYRDTGGIRSAVARSAEEVYEELPVGRRALLRDLMLRLVEPGPEGEVQRSRVPRRQLSTDAEHEQVLERLVGARLVTSDGDRVELAHEALARAWPRLRGWLDDDTEGQRILRHLAVASDTWESMGRPDDELYRGTRLARAREWRARAGPDLTPTEAAFLDASTRLAEAEERTAADRARQQARVNRRLRGLLTAAALLLVAALVAGGLAVRQADVAAEAGTAAAARRVATLAQMTDDIDGSLRLALAAHHVEPSGETRAGLLEALSRTPQLVRVLPGDLAWLEVAPDGTVATLDWHNVLRLHDGETLEQLGPAYDPFPPEWDLQAIGTASPLEFLPDSERVAVALLNGGDDVVRVVDVRTQEPVPRQPLHQPAGAHAWDLEVSPDGRWLAVVAEFVVGSSGSWAYLWDLERPESRPRRIRMPSDSFHVRVSPDGRRLYAAPTRGSDARGGGTWVYDVRTGELVDRYPEGGHGLQVSPDGRTLAWADGNEVVLAAAGTGRVLRRLDGPQGEVFNLDFSPDGSRVVGMSEDPAATVWATRTGRVVEEVPLTSAGGASQFDPSGRRLLVPAAGVQVLDLTGRQHYVRRIVPPDPVQAPPGTVSRFASPYAPLVAVGSWDADAEVALLHVVDRRTGRNVQRLGSPWAGNFRHDHAWSPDGRRLLVAGVDGRLSLYDVDTGELLAGRRMAATQLDFGHDGSEVLVEGKDGLRLHDGRTLDPLTDPVALPGLNVAESALVGTGREALVVTSVDTGSSLDFLASEATGWQLVDLGTGRRLHEGRLSFPVTTVEVSPDRGTVAVAGGGRLALVDVLTGEVRTAPESDAELPMGDWQLAWSPDGRRLVAGHDDGSVVLRDGRTGEVLGTVHPGVTEADPVFVDEDTVQLVYVDGSVYEWDVDQRHAVEAACRITGRGLDRDEWRRAFGGLAYVDTCAGTTSGG